jgi:hypothetical protein
MRKPIRLPLSKHIKAELDRLEPQVKAAFLKAIADVKNAIQLKVIIDHLEAGRIDQAIAGLRLDDAFFDPLGRLLGDVYLQGGRDAVARLPAIPDPFPVGDTCSPSMAEPHGPKNGSRKSHQN